MREEIARILLRNLHVIHRGSQSIINGLDKAEQEILTLVNDKIEMCIPRYNKMTPRGKGFLGYENQLIRNLKSEGLLKTKGGGE